MPGNNSCPSRNIFKKLSRTSCLTVLDTQPLARRSFNVEGRTLAAITRMSPQTGCTSAGRGPLAGTSACGGKFATCPPDRGQVANLPPQLAPSSIVAGDPARIPLFRFPQETAGTGGADGLRSA